MTFMWWLGSLLSGIVAIGFWFDHCREQAWQAQVTSLLMAVLAHLSRMDARGKGKR